MKDKKVKYYYNPFPYIKSIIPRTKALFSIFLILMLVCSVTGSGFFWSARSTRMNPLNSAYAQFDNNSITSNGETGQVNIPQQQSTQMLTYTNPIYGISIQYPADWTKHEGKPDKEFTTTEVAYFTAPDGIDSKGRGRELVSINIDPEPSNNLQKYLKSTISNDKIGTRHFSLVESNTNAVLSGEPAYLLTYTFLYAHKEAPKDYIDTKTTEIGTIIHGKAYYVYYQSDRNLYDKYFPAFQSIIGSINIGNTNIKSFSQSNTAINTQQKQNQYQSNGQLGSLQLNSNQGIESQSDVSPPTTQESSLPSVQEQSQLQEQDHQASNEVQSTPNNNTRFSSVSSDEGSSSSLLNYKNKYFAVSYPADWTVSGDDSENPPILVSIDAPTGAGGSIEIDVNDLDLAATTVSEVMIGYMPNTLEDNFKLVKSNEHAIFAGHPAYISQYTRGNPGDLTEDLEMGTILSGKSYRIDFSANQDDFSKQLPVVQKIMESFRIGPDLESNGTMSGLANNKQVTFVNKSESSEPNIQEASVVNKSESSTAEPVPLNAITVGNNVSLNPLALIMGENSSGQIYNTTNGNSVPVSTSENLPTESQSTLGESTTLSGTTNDNLQANNEVQTPNSGGQVSNSGSQVSNSPAQTGQPINTDQQSTNQPSTNQAAPMITSVPTPGGTGTTFSPKVTNLEVTDTSYKASIEIPTNPPSIAHISMTSTPNVKYMITPTDMNLLRVTGIPVFNFHIDGQLTDTQATIQMKFFLPYDSLPPDFVAKLKALSPQPTSLSLPPSDIKQVSFNPQSFSFNRMGNYDPYIKFIAEEGSNGGGQSTFGKIGSAALKVYDYYNEHARVAVEGVEGVVVETIERAHELGATVKLTKAENLAHEFFGLLGDAADVFDLGRETNDIKNELQEIQDCLENPNVPFFSEEDRQRAEKAFTDSVIEAYGTMITKADFLAITKANVGLGKRGEVLLYPVTQMGDKAFEESVKQALVDAKKLIGDPSKCHKSYKVDFVGDITKESLEAQKSLPYTDTSLRHITGSFTVPLAGDKPVTGEGKGEIIAFSSMELNSNGEPPDTSTNEHDHACFYDIDRTDSGFPVPYTFSWSVTKAGGNVLIVIHPDLSNVVMHMFLNSGGTGPCPAIDRYDPLDIDQLSPNVGCNRVTIDLKTGTYDNGGDGKTEPKCTFTIKAEQPPLKQFEEGSSGQPTQTQTTNPPPLKQFVP